MRSYQIYFIEDEFAQHYYGREKLFYQLFQEHRNSTGELKGILDLQVDYITKSIPFLPFHRLVVNVLQKRKDFSFEGCSYQVGDSAKMNGAELLWHDRSLQLCAWGSYDSEFAFFEVLRQFDGRLLAVDLVNQRFGWVKPIKERKYV